MADPLRSCQATCPKCLFNKPLWKCGAKTLAIRRVRSVDLSIQRTVDISNRWRAIEGATDALLCCFGWQAGGWLELRSRNENDFRFRKVQKSNGGPWALNGRQGWVRVENIWQNFLSRFEQVSPAATPPIGTIWGREIPRSRTAAYGGT